MVLVAAPTKLVMVGLLLPRSRVAVLLMGQRARTQDACTGIGVNHGPGVDGEATAKGIRAREVVVPVLVMVIWPRPSSPGCRR